MAGSSTDLVQLDVGWAQSCICVQVTGHLRAEWSLIDGINQLCSVWSNALIRPCCHGDHRETREEAETYKASSGLDSVTLFLSHCTGQSKSQHQPNLEWAETTKLSGKEYGYVEAIKLIESINAFDLTQGERANFN